MKRMLLFGMLGFMIVWSGLSAVAENSLNLVKNSSFETVNSTTGLPENWNALIRQSKDKKAECRFSVVSEAQDGNSAAKMTAPEQGKKGALAEFSQFVPVKPKTKYYFAVYMKVPAYVNAWPCAVVEERTRNKGYPMYAVASNHLAKAADKAVPDQYQLLETTFTTGAETAFVNISLRLQNLGSGNVQFDNVLLLEQPE